MKNENNSTSLIGFLKEHADHGMVSFHMPGHKGSNIFEEFGYGDFIKNLVDMDVTEIPGADNLFQPETVIKEIMDRYASYYECKKTFLSIGGSSAGLIASILATAERSIVVMARNCHKSIYNGVQLAGAKPVYIYPEDSGEISPSKIKETLSELHESADMPADFRIAVVIPSPNYYGVVSDIKSISEICHEYGAVLIVDQAHGAHLKMFSKGGVDEMPQPAEELGADVVVNSIHKTLASFTQTAIINVCSDRIDIESLADKLQMIQSSSPSYILMSSIEMNIDILEEHGDQLTKRWKENLDYFYKKAATIPKLKISQGFGEDKPSEDYPGFDRTKILLDMREAGLGGYMLERELEKRGIVLELSDSNIAMAMTGIGNTREDYDRLLAVLRELSLLETDGRALKDGLSSYDAQSSDGTPDDYHSSNDADYVLGKEEVDAILSHIGEVAREAVIPYPPGVPLIAKGEMITEDLIKEAIGIRQQGQKVIGLDILTNSLDNSSNTKG